MFSRTVCAHGHRSLHKHRGLELMCCWELLVVLRGHMARAGRIVDAVAGRTCSGICFMCNGLSPLFFSFLQFSPFPVGFFFPFYSLSLSLCFLGLERVNTVRKQNNSLKRIRQQKVSSSLCFNSQEDEDRCQSPPCVHMFTKSPSLLGKKKENEQQRNIESKRESRIESFLSSE